MALSAKKLPNFRRYSDNGKYSIIPAKFSSNTAYMEVRNWEENQHVGSIMLVLCKCFELLMFSIIRVLCHAGSCLLAVGYI